MAGDDTAKALRCRRIEPDKPKKVKPLSTFRDHTGKLTQEPYRSDILLLRRCIEEGKPIPTRMYRKKIDRDEDELLKVLGVKHFHLGGQYSNVLLYAAEFDDCVYLLEINDHKHLDRKPVGKILESALRTPLKTAQTEVAAQREKDTVEAARKAAELTEKVQRGFKPKPSK